MTGEPSILVLNQMAGPMTWELVEDLAVEVGTVALLTGHPDTLAKSPGERILVTAAAPYHRGSYPRRIASWLRYLLQAWRWIRRWPATTPVLFFSNPPLAPWLGWLLHRLRGQRFAVMVHDLYPDVLVGLRGVSPRNPVVQIWRSLNRRAYHRADLVMTLGELMAERLKDQCPGHEIDVIYPWADTERIRPRPKKGNRFAEQHDLLDKLTVMYSGNMGLGHDIETMLEAADRLRDRDDIRFVFVGAGPKWRLVEDVRKKKKLDNVILLDWQPEDVLPYSLSAADVAVVSLEIGLDGLAIPSKAFSFLAAGAALLLISRKGSELAMMIRRHDCGWLVDPGDTDRFAELVVRAAEHPERLRVARRNSRQTAERLGSRSNSRRITELVQARLGAAPGER